MGSVRLRSDDVEALRRHLLPGEAVIQRYKNVVSQRRFRAVLTDRRILLLGRNAVEEIHINAVSSMGWRARRRWGLVATGVLLFGLSYLALSSSGPSSSNREYLGIVGGIALIVVGSVLRRHAVHVYASGRDFEFVGKSGNIAEFLRDVRLQQNRLPGYAIPGGSPLGVPTIQAMNIHLPPAPPPPPMARLVREKETISEIVKIPCKYCDSLVPITAGTCPSCSAAIG